MFRDSELELLLKIIRQGLLQAFGETLLMTFVPTILAFVIGLPLGILLVTGEEKGIRPLPPFLMKLLNFLINILRSVPFLILLIVVLPLSRLLVGTTVGTKAILAPLVITDFPGPRTYYATTLCLVSFCLLLFLELLANRGKRLRTALCLVCLALTLVLGIRLAAVYAPIGEVSRQRDRLIDRAREEQADALCLPAYPNEAYLWLPDPVSEERLEYFRAFYQIPEQTRVSFAPPSSGD